MEFRIGSIYVRQAPQLLETGFSILGDVHNFGHATMFFSGKWKVEAWQAVIDAKGNPVMETVTIDVPNVGPTEVEKPMKVKVKEATVQGGAPHAMVNIDPNLMHNLILLEGPGCYACVYSHRTPDGDVTEEYTGWSKAYE